MTIPFQYYYYSILVTADEQSLMAEATPTAMQGSGDQRRPEQVQSTQRKKWTTNPAEGVDLIIGESGLEAEAPSTVGRMFKDTVERIPDHAAHMYKENGEWKTITYKQHYDRCFAAAKSFLKVDPHSCISVRVFVTYRVVLHIQLMPSRTYLLNLLSHLFPY